MVATLAQSENPLPEPELPLIRLDSRYNREGQLRRSAGPPAFPLRPHTVDEDVPAMKRAVDLTSSLIALALLSPLFLGVALAIKLTSKGPVFYRQKRIGQYGVPFVFLKFRSICFVDNEACFVDNEASKHNEYVRKLIAGKAERHSVGSGEGVYKFPSYPRVTRVGSFLRKTSLDELPQFINVLKGEMSLVGPRVRVFKDQHPQLGSNLQILAVLRSQLENREDALQVVSSGGSL
jgi:lipopolysaccharide/colanic/teichoic acid biosynthesis glycosyltransferase